MIFSKTASSYFHQVHFIDTNDYMGDFPTKEAIKGMPGRLCSSMPFLASIRIMARLAVEAPVTDVSGILDMTRSVCNDKPLRLGVANTGMLHQW